MEGKLRSESSQQLECFFFTAQKTSNTYVLKCRDLCQESNVSNTDEGLFFSAEENFH